MTWWCCRHSVTGNGCSIQRIQVKFRDCLGKVAFCKNLCTLSTGTQLFLQTLLQISTLSCLICITYFCYYDYSLEFAVKKERFQAAGTRAVKFLSGGNDIAALKPSGKVLNITIARGLPNNTRK